MSDASGGHGSDDQAYKALAKHLVRIEDIFPKIFAEGQALTPVEVRALSAKFGNRTPPAAEEDILKLFYNLAIFRDEIYVLQQKAATLEWRKDNAQREILAAKTELIEFKEEGKLAANFLLKIMTLEDALSTVIAHRKEFRKAREDAIVEVKKIDEKEPSVARPGSRDAILAESDHLVPDTTRKFRLLQARTSEADKSITETEISLTAIKTKLPSTQNQLTKLITNLTELSALNVDSIEIKNKPKHLTGIADVEGLVHKKTSEIEALKKQETDLIKKLENLHREKLVIAVAMENLKISRLATLEEGITKTIEKRLNPSTAQDHLVEKWFPLDIDLNDPNTPYPHIVDLYNLRQDYRRQNINVAERIQDTDLGIATNQYVRYGRFRGYSAIIVAGLGKLWGSDFTRQERPVIFDGTSSQEPTGMSLFDQRRYAIAVQSAAFISGDDVYEEHDGHLLLNDTARGASGKDIQSGMAHYAGFENAIKRANGIMGIIKNGTEIINRWHPLAKRSFTWPFLSAGALALLGGGITKAGLALGTAELGVGLTPFVIGAGAFGLIGLVTGNRFKNSILLSRVSEPKTPQNIAGTDKKPEKEKGLSIPLVLASAGIGAAIGIPLIPLMGVVAVPAVAIFGAVSPLLSKIPFPGMKYIVGIAGAATVLLSGASYLYNKNSSVISDALETGQDKVKSSFVEKLLPSWAQPNKSSSVSKEPTEAELQAASNKEKGIKTTEPPMEIKRAAAPDKSAESTKSAAEAPAAVPDAIEPPEKINRGSEPTVPKLEAQPTMKQVAPPPVPTPVEPEDEVPLRIRRSENNLKPSMEAQVIQLVQRGPKSNIPPEQRESFAPKNNRLEDGKVAANVTATKLSQDNTLKI